MNKEKLSLGVFLSTFSILLASCKTFPKMEHCIVGDAGLICHDPRLEGDKQDYTRPFTGFYQEGGSKNMICTNPDDFQTAEEWIVRHDK